MRIIMFIKPQQLIHIIVFRQNHEKHIVGNVKKHHNKIPDKFEIVAACGFLKMIPKEDKIVDLLLSKIKAIQN